MSGGCSGWQEAGPSPAWSRNTGPVRFLAESLVTDKDEPGRLVEVDFSGATLRRVEFEGLSLDQATLPEEGEAHVIVHHYPCVVRRAVALLGDDRSADVRRLRARMHAEEQRMDDARSVAIWHVDELGQDAEQRRHARDLLHRLDRECAEG